MVICWSALSCRYSVIDPSHAAHRRPLLAMTLAAAALAPVDVNANSGQAVGTVTPSTGAAGLTGKERLSEKWKDEQRIDNCKVPIDKRGAKARPDSCEHPPKD